MASVAGPADRELSPTPPTAQLATFHLGRASFLAAPAALRDCALVSPSRARPKAGVLEEPAFNHFWRPEIVARHLPIGELLRELLTRFLRICVAV